MTNDLLPRPGCDNVTGREATGSDKTVWSTLDRYSTECVRMWGICGRLQIPQISHTSAVPLSADGAQALVTTYLGRYSDSWRMKALVGRIGDMSQG